MQSNTLLWSRREEQQNCAIQRVPFGGKHCLQSQLCKTQDGDNVISEESKKTVVFNSVHYKEAEPPRPIDPRGGEWKSYAPF